MRDIAYLELDEIAAPKLAVDGEIEKGKISNTLGRLQSDPDRPDFSGFQGGGRPDQSALVPRIVVGADLGAICCCCTWCVSSLLTGETQVWFITIQGDFDPNRTFVHLQFT